jgi:hypothetical protein
MSADDETGRFERQTRAMLEESLSHIDARVRSRLNRARQAALAQLAERQPALYRNRFFVPAGAAAGAAAVFLMLALWNQKATRLEVNEETQSSFEDLELLADGEAFELLDQGEDPIFYEWAATEG